MTKKILSVGFELPDENIETISLKSEQSLLDGDIIVFSPDISDYYYGHDTYNGKFLLSRSNSTSLQSDLSHWQAEIKTACESGKNVFFFLKELDTLSVHTGVQTFSGTGRNRQTTNVVTETSNYKLLPIPLGKMIPKSGSEMRLLKNASLFSSYWSEFSQYSQYKFYFNDPNPSSIISTKNGDKCVGSAHKIGKGWLILLPYLEFDNEEFVEESKTADEFVWTPKALQLGKKLISILVEIDKVLRKDSQKTPTPDWAKQDEFQLREEVVAREKLKEVAQKAAELEAERKTILNDLQAAGNLRGLLYETGHPLEEAILESLRLMGFTAELVKEGESEFDAVFTSAEGRFLGEAEGKDNSAIGIDKLRQLETNIQEDFGRDEVETHARGVLFGNAFRLKSLVERGDFFTVKCLSSAERNRAALVRTPDLFNVAKYLKENLDEEFAKNCRKALLDAAGEVVTFPTPPSSG